MTIKGKPYLVEVDEYSASPDGDVDRPRVARRRRADHRHLRRDASRASSPTSASQVHQPENRAAIAGDYGAQSPVQGYAGHYCNVPQRNEPGIFACSMITSGLRVFDIRDPENPKEIAYYVSPPSTISATGGPVIDERSNWAMSQPAFAPERGEIWYSDGNSGFYALKMDPRGLAVPGGRRLERLHRHDGLRVGRCARPSGRGVSLTFERRADLPVRVDVFRVSQGRRVLRERLVARFDKRTSSLTWNGRPNRGSARRQGRAGTYFVRFTMLKDGRAYDRRRIVISRRADGRFAPRPAHYQRESCNLCARSSSSGPSSAGRRAGRSPGRTASARAPA